MRSRVLAARAGLRTLVLLLLVTLLAVACDSLNGLPYEETFDSLGSWGSGSDVEAEGTVNEGEYRLRVLADTGLFWSTAGESFGDGVYQLEATQLEGPLDNSYGMIFRADIESDDFYLFTVSGDGFIWIGRCTMGCQEDVVPLIGDGWIESPAVNQGLNNTNRLRVRAEGPNLIFYVNDTEVGRVTDDAFERGDIGVLVETLGEGGVLVGFDNFTVTELEELE